MIEQIKTVLIAVLITGIVTFVSGAIYGHSEATHATSVGFHQAK